MNIHAHVYQIPLVFLFFFTLSFYLPYPIAEYDDGGKLMVYSRWGRVGVKGQDKLNGPYKSPESAIQEFEQKFYAKTKNQWSNRKEFVCHPKCYAWLEMDYTETERVFVCVSTTGTYKRNLHLFHPSMMQRLLLQAS